MIHSFGLFELDEQRFELRRRGKPVALSRRVLETIAYLVKNRERLISKDELLAGPWKGTMVSDAALSRSIMLARRALSDRNGRKQLIQTVRGKGYRFLAEVSSVRSPRAPVKETRAAAVPAARAFPSSPVAPYFFGRRAEIETMTEALGSAVAGRGGVILVGGEPGIGKTTLLQAFVARATTAELLWGRCWEGEGAPAFWPWLEIIRSYNESHGERALTMMGPGVLDIAQLMPDMRAGLAQGSLVVSDRDNAQARFRTFDSISRFFVRAAADTPLVLVIDDLHAADEASVLLLEFLARSVETSKLLIIASYRDLQVGNHPALASLLGVGGTTMMTLSGLGEDDVGALLASHLQEQLAKDVVHRVRSATDGNPFLVGELARALRSGARDRRYDFSAIDAFRIPDRLATVVRRHLERLPPGAVRALSVASVIGREFNLTLLADLCGHDRERIAIDLEPAFLEGFVRSLAATPGVSTFSHALIRETLYQLLPTAERLALHFAIADRLERGLAAANSKGDPRVFQIAHHHFAAVPHKGTDKALEWALKAAAQAHELFGYELAARHCEHALHLLELSDGLYTQKCDVLLRLAHAQALAGQVPSALLTFERVETIAGDHGDHDYLAKGLLGCADTLRDGAVIHPTLGHRLEEALQMLPPTDGILRARVLSALPIAGFFRASMAERLGTYCEQAIVMARRLGDPDTLARALHTANWRMMGDGTSPERALIAASEMIEVARQACHGEKQLDGHLWRSYYLQQLGRRAEFEAEVEDHARLATRLRHPLHLWWASLASCAQALRMGQLRSAEELATKALVDGLPLQGLHAEAVFVAQMLASALEKDGDVRSRAMAEIATRTTRILERYPPLLPLQATLAIIEAEIGSASEAKSAFERIIDDALDDAPRDQNLLPSLAILSQLARAFRDVERARVLYERVAPHAGRHVIIANVAVYWGPVSHHLGVLAMALSQPELAITHFERAVVESHDAKAPVWKARAQCELGELLRTTLDREERARATRLLRSAVAAAHRLDLPRLASRASVGLEQQRQDGLQGPSRRLSRVG